MTSLRGCNLAAQYQLSRQTAALCHALIRMANKTVVQTTRRNHRRQVRWFSDRPMWLTCWSPDPSLGWIHPRRR